MKRTWRTVLRLACGITIVLLACVGLARADEAGTAECFKCGSCDGAHCCAFPDEGKRGWDYCRASEGGCVESGSSCVGPKKKDAMD